MTTEDQPAPVPRHHDGSQGILLGVAAVVFWSFGSSLIFMGAREAGTWSFVAVSSMVGGALQLVARLRYHGEVRTAIRLPWRLWAVPVFCFVLYGLAWPWALASSTPAQVFGVSLINYLWPVLTVVLSAWLVPGVRLTARLLLALLLAGAGLVCANLAHIRELMAAGGDPGLSSARRFLPYALALMAAVTWAVYSAVLARWRTWARQFVTSPVGFLLTGLCGAVIAGLTGHSAIKPTTHGVVMILLYAAGPLAAGYLLWEIALSKARVHSLSLVAAATPVLSTLLLCLFLRSMPGLELLVAACLVSAGVVLSLME